MYLPKFLSPLNSSNMNTPICIKPSRAEKRLQDSINNSVQYFINEQKRQENNPGSTVNRSQKNNSRTHIGQILHHLSGKVLEPRYPAHHYSSARKTKISTNRKISGYDYLRKQAKLSWLLWSWQLQSLSMKVFVFK